MLEGKRTLLKHTRIKQSGLVLKGTFPSGHNPLNCTRTKLLIECSVSKHRVGMEDQRSAIATTTIALLVIIIVLVGAMGGVLLTSQSVTHTVTITSIQTTIVTTVSNTNQTSTTTCVVAVPPPQGIYLRLINDGGSPIAGSQVTVQSTSSAHCYTNDVHPTNSVAVTNSSGWILFQGWLYYFVFTYSGGTYNFTVPSDPMAWTIATISVPSGTLTSEICGLGGGGLNSSCSIQTTTSITKSAGSTT